MKEGTLAWFIKDYQSKIDAVNRSGINAFSDVKRLLEEFFSPASRPITGEMSIPGSKSFTK